MKIIFFSLLLYLPVISSAQKVEQYCEMSVVEKSLTYKVSIELNFGQYRQFISYNDPRIKDSTGKTIKFNSIIDAMNFVAEQGWVYLMQLPHQSGMGGTLYRIIFKKEIEKAEIIK